MVDAADLKSVDRKVMWVRVPPRAHFLRAEDIRREAAYSLSCRSLSGRVTGLQPALRLPSQPSRRYTQRLHVAGVAQWLDRLTVTQEAAGSSPVIRPNFLAKK